MDAFEAVADKLCKVFSTDGRPHGILRGAPTYYRNNDPEYGRNDAARDCVDRFHNRHQLGLSDYGYPGRSDEETIKLSGLLTLTAQTNRGPLALEQAVLSTGASAGNNPSNGYWVVIPVRANSELRRINWHWFRFKDRKELEQFIGEYQHGVGVGTELVDSDGMVVADDLVGIDMGWNHFGWPNSTPSVSILSPFLCAKTNYQKVFFKTFSFKRKIELTQEEAGRVRELKCSLQAAAWGTPSEVVRDSRTR